jgi:hypothetical protein
MRYIRQSHVTEMLDVTNFGTLSRLTEALDLNGLMMGFILKNGIGTSFKFKPCLSGIMQWAAASIRGVHGGLPRTIFLLKTL